MGRLNLSNITQSARVSNRSLTLQDEWEMRELLYARKINTWPMQLKIDYETRRTMSAGAKGTKIRIRSLHIGH